jgi:ATP-dependent protease ClpP protease subunit
MQTAAAEPALAAGPLDEQLTARLLQQRIIVLGSEVEDRIANRLCAQLLLSPAVKGIPGASSDSGANGPPCCCQGSRAGKV